jgi:hypothetical protein
MVAAPQVMPEALEQVVEFASKLQPSMSMPQPT